MTHNVVMGQPPLLDADASTPQYQKGQGGGSTKFDSNCRRCVRQLVCFPVAIIMPQPIRAPRSVVGWNLALYSPIRCALLEDSSEPVQRSAFQILQIGSVVLHLCQKPICCLPSPLRGRQWKVADTHFSQFQSQANKAEVQSRLTGA